MHLNPKVLLQYRVCWHDRLDRNHMSTLGCTSDTIIINCYCTNYHIVGLYHTLFTVIIISLLLAGGGQLRSATLAWCRQTFRACAMTLVTSPSSSSAPTTTTGSTRAVSSLTWRMTRTLSRVRSTSTKHLRKVTFSRESPSLSFCHRRNNTLLRF